MNVTIKQLRAFITVAQSASYAEACEKLNLSQPALSITIKNLEETLGGSLMTRTTRTLALTPEGEAFLQIAKRVMSDWDNAFNDVSNMFLLKRGKLSIAAMPFVSASILPGILTQYHQQHPNIVLSLHDVVNEEVINSVRTGRVELGICFDPGKTDDLEFTELFNEELHAIVPPNNSLAPLGSISWAELLSFPFIALHSPASLREDIRKTMEEHGIPFSVHLETHQLTTIGEMVAAGLGVSAVPKSLLKQMKKMGAVCRPLCHPIISRKVGIISRRRYELSVAAHTMKDFIIDYHQQRLQNLLQDESY